MLEDQHDSEYRKNWTPVRARGVNGILRAFLVAAAWCITAILCGGLNPVLFIWFPHGLVAALTDSTHPQVLEKFAPVGWLFYITMTTILFAVRKAAIFWPLYVLLLLAFFLNVKGCHAIWHDIGQIKG
jgi:hypothetical protein